MIPDCLSLELTFGTLTEGPYCYSLLTFKMYPITSLSKRFSLYTVAACESSYRENVWMSPLMTIEYSDLISDAHFIDLH